MIIEYKINESTIEAAWLKTLYELVEELNCRCNTYLQETHSKSFKSYSRTRIIEIYGSATMVSWLKLRMERYIHYISSFNEALEVRVISDKEED